MAVRIHESTNRVPADAPQDKNARHTGRQRKSSVARPRGTCRRVARAPWTRSETATAPRGLFVPPGIVAERVTRIAQRTPIARRSAAQPDATASNWGAEVAKRAAQRCPEASASTNARRSEQIAARTELAGCFPTMWTARSSSTATPSAPAAPVIHAGISRTVGPT
jgi:hypothetical protein